jgi:hypothetical protein
MEAILDAASRGEDMRNLFDALGVLLGVAS